MGKRFKRRDWQKMLARLAEARVALEAARTQPDMLDRVVWCVWTFSEYAINVVLELAEHGPETHHDQAGRSEELRAGGMLKGDYTRALRQLEDYRRKASYLGYATCPSTHYNLSNVRSCLESMEALKTEVEALLKAEGKLS